MGLGYILRVHPKERSDGSDVGKVEVRERIMGKTEPSTIMQYTASICAQVMIESGKHYNDLHSWCTTMRYIGKGQNFGEIEVGIVLI